MPFNSLIDRDNVAGLIPTETAAGVIQGTAEQSVALRTFRRVTMPRGVTEMPVLSVLPSAYWVGATDTGLKQTSEQNWENVTLTARELAVIIPIPQAVLDDATLDLWAEIRPRLAEAFGTKIDAAVLFGTDAPAAWPDSIAEAAVAANNDSAGGGSDLAADISTTWALVEDDGFDVNVQYARRNIRSRLRGLRDDQNALLLQDGLSNGSPSSIYGEDLLYVSNGAWDNDYDLIVGDRSAAIIGVRQDIDYRLFFEGVVSDDSGNVVLNLMQQDAVALRATMRVAFATAVPATAHGGAGGDAATGYPFAVLTGSGS
jgi:HK97 family phage major capsid protein